jgi:two-component system, NarL family, response regulator DevR
MVATSLPPLKILFCGEQALFREAIGFALSQAAEMEVVAELDDAAAAVRIARRTRPDVAFIDVGLPVGDLHVVSEFAEQVPECSVIVMARREEEALLLRAVLAGASGFLTRRAHLTELLDAARAVHRGEAVIPAASLRWLLSELAGLRRERAEALTRLSGLSNRERQVLAYVSRGADNRAIARALRISPETARTHVQNMLGKLGVHSRLGAAAFVGRHRDVEDALAREVPAARGPRQVVFQRSSSPA